jgi:hypothetical protein
VLHVQSEVAAGRRAHVRTQLFLDGTVLASQREAVGEDMSSDEIDRKMRAQHVAILRELTRGCYDQAVADAPVVIEPEPEPARLPTRAPMPELRKTVRRRGQPLEIVIVDEGTVVGNVMAELRYVGKSLAVQRIGYPEGADGPAVVALMSDQLDAMIAKIRRGGFDARLPGFVFEPPPMPGGR